MLFNSIQSAQNGDQNEMLYLISRFQSVICKYAVIADGLCRPIAGVI